MISNNDQRVLVDNAGVFEDLTKEVNNFGEGFKAITLDVGDFLYFGSFLPFNQKYFEFVKGNGTASPLKIEIYDGSVWKECLDILDYTELSGKPLGKSGVLQFNKVDTDNWSLVSKSSEVTALSGSPEIYSKYWARISIAAASSLSIKYIGSKFARHDELLGEYPALGSPTLLESWAEGKQDWKEQLITASEYVIADLKKRGIITERSQVIEQSVLLEPTIHKAAQIIFNGLGSRNYAEEIKDAQGFYKSAMNMEKFEQDANGSGQKERFEQVVSTSRASR